MTQNQKNLFLAASAAVGAGLVAWYLFKDSPNSKSMVETAILGEPENLLSEKEVQAEFSLNEDESGFFFGRYSDGRPGYIGKPADTDGHILVVGSPGSGKTTAVAEPTARTWKGSSISLLIKGDVNQRIQELEAAGRTVLVFNPAAGEENPTRFDVFAALDKYPADRIDNARAIAEALLPMPDGTREPVWVHAAQALLSAALLFYNALGYTFPAAMKEILAQNVSELVAVILDSGNEAAILCISKLANAEKKLIQNTGFELTSLFPFVSPQIASALTVSPEHTMLDWETISLSITPIDVLLVVPEEKLDLWKPMLTIMIEQLIKTLMSRPERTYGDEELPPLLLALDEFIRVGRIPSVVHGLATLRSRGVTIALFLQSIASLDLVYGSQTARVIADNCTFKVVLQLTEPAGQTFFSELIGRFETVSISRSQGSSVGISPSVALSRSQSESYTYGEKPIISPQAFYHLSPVVCITPLGVFQCHKEKITQEESILYRKEEFAMKTLSKTEQELTMETTIRSVQELHRKEKAQAKEKTAKRKSTLQIAAHLKNEIYAIFPDVKALAESDSSTENVALWESIEGILSVLRFAAAHPKFVESIRTGRLK